MIANHFTEQMDTALKGMGLNPEYWQFGDSLEELAVTERINGFLIELDLDIMADSEIVKTKATFLRTGDEIEYKDFDLSGRKRIDLDAQDIYKQLYNFCFDITVVITQRMMQNE